MLEAQIRSLAHLRTQQIVGSIASLQGLKLLVDDLPLPIGSLVRIGGPGRAGGFVDRPSPAAAADAAGGAVPVRGEVVGFEGTRTIVMLLGANAGLAQGMPVIGEHAAQTVQVGRSLLGRVIDGFGRPIDGGPRLIDCVARPLVPPPTQPLRRRRIDQPLPTGIRSIDGFVTLGKGQRVGVFSGPGVGKSTLLGAVARNTAADVNVIGLIGERGREVREFIENALGPAGLARSVVVVATSDQSPLLRVRAAMVACAVAEYFRDPDSMGGGGGAAGADVMLMMDSITRFAQAQRQIGLTVGEQPATKGYTPSVFAMLPVLLERAGAIQGAGSITGLYAVLVEGDDLNEPISDAARGVLDGHVALSRRLAGRGHYPAVDVLDSISRVAAEVCDARHVAARQTLIRLLAAHAEADELINIGAYARGSNPYCDIAIEMRPQLERFLQQPVEECAGFPHTCKALIELSAEAEQLLQKAQKGARPALNSPPSAGARPSSHVHAPRNS